MTAPLRLVAVSAGLSDPSSTRLLADRLTSAAVSALGERGRDAEVEIVELRAHAVGIATALTSGFPPEALADAIRSVTESDALVAVTPVFTASYSGLFKSFFDLLDPSSLRGRPVLIGATGGSERHSLVLDHALRPLFGYLGARVEPTGVYAATSDWGRADAGLPERIERAAGELAETLVGRAPAGTVAPATEAFPDFVPFDRLVEQGDVQL